MKITIKQLRQMITEAASEVYVSRDVGNTYKALEQAIDALWYSYLKNPNDLRAGDARQAFQKTKQIVDKIMNKFASTHTM